MKIRSVETSIIEIPFTDGGRGEGITPTTWNTLETVLVRVEDTDGVVGWGEGFGYFCADATKYLIDRNVAPLTVGTAIHDIPAWNLQMQRRLHLFGRYGVTIFAISGVDLALWDLQARRAGVPLRDLLGPGRQTELEFYASLVRYADPLTAPVICEQALRDGFTDLKLHEITLEDIDACRAVIGTDVPVSVDVNGNWSNSEALANVHQLRERGCTWLEEPIFPPEDFAGLRKLRGHGLDVAAGENWCTAVQFAAAAAARAVDVLQPSVTKVGGVSEFLGVAAVAREHDLGLLPHCPYFGPGFFTTMHLAAAQPEVGQLEYLYVEPEAMLADIGPLLPGGRLNLPDGTGNGFTPDPDVIRRYRRA
jgi:L-alanine-DL-glutamate epimerase-like enolase superfamily enzyme